MISYCPFCDGYMSSGRCERCGLAVGEAKVGRRRKEGEPDRTIASAGAEMVGRPARDLRASFDDGPALDDE